MFGGDNNSGGNETNLLELVSEVDIIMIRFTGEMIFGFRQ